MCTLNKTKASPLPTLPTERPTPEDEGRSAPLGRPFVIGVDTSSARLAVSLPKHRTFVADATGSPDERRRELFRAARKLFGGLPASAHIFCEQPLALAKNGNTTSMLGLAAGAIWAAHVDFDVYWWWLPISTWKSTVVGKGNASKDEVRAWAEANAAFHHENREAFLVTPDLYDAWAMRIYGVRALRQRT